MGAIRALDTKSGKQIKLTNSVVHDTNVIKFIKPSSSEIFCLKVSPDGKYLFASSADKNVYQWDLSTMKIVRIYKEVSEGFARFIEISQNDKY